MSNYKPTYAEKKLSQGWLWSEKEVQILKEKGGKVTIDELSKILNRTKRNIISKASELKINISNKTKWTQKDDDIIRKNARSKEISEIADILNVSESSLKSRASKIGVSLSTIHRRWNDDELQFLTENAGLLEPKEIAKKLNRSLSSIQSYASINKISLETNINKWTNESIELLKSYNGKLSIEELYRKFSNKSRASLIYQINKYKIKVQPIKDKFIVEINGEIVKNVLTLYELHKSLKNKGYPVGGYQSIWIKSKEFQNNFNISKFQKVNIYIHNGISSSVKMISYIITESQANEIKCHYKKLIQNSKPPKNMVRSYELYKDLKGKSIVSSLTHGSFLKLTIVRNFIYEENILIIPITLKTNTSFYVVTNGFLISRKQAKELKKLLSEYKFREKNPGSYKLRSLQSRIRDKYGNDSMSHLYSYGNKSMVYMIENYAIINKKTDEPKRYIGIWKNTNSEEYICSGILVYQDMLKYGPNKFKKVILFKHDDYETILDKESYFINKYKTNEKQRSHEGHWGYNQTDGGKTAAYTTAVIIYDYFEKKEYIYSSMMEAEYELKLSQMTLSGNITRNNRKNGIPFLIKNRYIALYLKDKEQLYNKIKLMEESGRINVSKPVLSICPFTMKVIQKYKTSDEASKMLNGNSSLSGDIRKTCNEEDVAMVKNYFWIYEDNLPRLKELFYNFHKKRIHKMIKRVNVLSGEVKYYYYYAEASKDNNTNHHKIKKHIKNGKLFNDKYIFKYIV